MTLPAIMNETDLNSRLARLAIEAAEQIRGVNTTFECVRDGIAEESMTTRTHRYFVCANKHKAKRKLPR